MGYRTGRICIYILTILSANGFVNGLIKKWVPNTNYENPKNWNVGRLPCPNDVVRFPEDAGTVYIQANTSVQELILPVNGELVLANYMSFSFPSHSNDVSCPGQEVTFNGSKAHSWYDPENWCEIADPEGSCLSEAWPRLDTERLPCQMDQAVFPHGSGFHVDLQTGVDIFLGKLTIRGKDFTTGQFKSYLNSASGKKEFDIPRGHGSTSINIRNYLCSDPTGCPCGNDGGLLEQKVCDIQSSRCHHMSCNSPILPQGHCCHICGSILTMDFDAGFKYKSLENMIHNIIPRKLRQSIRVIISRLHSEQVQVVIEELDGTHQVKALVDLIRQKVKPNSEGRSRYKISKIHVLSSDKVHGSSVQAHTEGSKMMRPGSIASLVIAVLVIIAIIALAIFCLKDRRQPNKASSRVKLPIPTVSWSFKRFGQDDGAGAMEMGPSQSFNASPPGMIDTVHGFDNPIYYGGNRVEVNGHSTEGANVPVSTVDVMEPTFVRKEHETAFANPMYGDHLKGEEGSCLDSSVRMNPIFSTEGLEEDSQI